MIITLLIIVVPVWMTRGIRGTLRVIPILFAGFVGFLEVYYLLNYLNNNNYSDFSESIIKPIYLSLLIATGLLILISQRKDIFQYKFFKDTINKQ